MTDSTAKLARVRAITDWPTRPLYITGDLMEKLAKIEEALNE